MRSTVAKSDLLLALACCAPFVMGASINIETPEDGGNTNPWDCSLVAGTASCSNGSPVTGRLYKKNSQGIWVGNYPLGPLMLTATKPLDGSQVWDTTPDKSMGTNSVYTSSGQYKVRVTLWDNATMGQAADENFWFIP